MAQLKLLSTEILYNYVEPGDKLYITVTFESSEKLSNDLNAEIIADIVFAGRHRLESGRCNSYSVRRKPFPEFPMWEAGDVWSVTCAWTVPETWGGSYNIFISLQNENGERLPFIGKEGKEVYSQLVTETDIGWGWGRPRLLEQRKPVTVRFNEPAKRTVGKTPSYHKLGDFYFNTAYPSVCGFGGRLWQDLPTVLTLRKISDNSVLSYVGNDGVDFTLKASSESELIYLAENPLCSFTLQIKKTEKRIELLLTDVKTSDDYELISFEIPSLVQTVDESDRIINTFGGGRCVRIKDSLMQSVDFYYDACSALGAVSGEGSFAVVTDDPDIVLKQSVAKRSQEAKIGVIGALFRVHIPANKSGMKSIPVASKPLELCYEKGEDEFFAAKLLRERLPENYEKIYENTLLYKIRLDASGQYNPEKPETYSPVVTLADAKRIIMSVYGLSGGMKQVVYLVGWQTGGHDFEYPYPHLSPFNPKCGTKAEFNDLREELKKYNVELSLHDNFDDAYLSDNYEINKNILAADAEGDPWKGWLWAGGMSYIISPKAYLKTDDITDRIDTILSDYGIKETYHLDVLSSEVRRYSFAQNELSSAEDNIKAKLGIIDLFNQRGVDVTSETLSQPFIGKIGYAQNTRFQFTTGLFKGDRVIPFTTVAFHGVTPYKSGADGEKLSLLRAIACGASCSIEIEDNPEDAAAVKNMARNIYIVSLPMTALSYYKAVDAKTEKNGWTVEYENDSRVTVDFEKLTYEIIKNGRIISKNFTTFMPLSDGRYCYYSLTAGKARAELPKAWKSISVLPLPDGEAFEAATADGVFTFDAKADLPYIFEKTEASK